MVGLTGIEPINWPNNPLKSLSLFFYKTSQDTLWSIFYCQHYNLDLQDSSNYLTRHFRPVVPYALIIYY